MKKFFTLALALMSAVVLMAQALPATQVRAIYSDVYSADCNFGEWSSGTQYTAETGYKHFVTAGGGYFGLEHAHLNCSQMEGLHIEINPTTACTVRLVPIHGGAEKGVTTATLNAGEWNVVEIALTEGDWAQVEDWSDVFQLKIDQAPNLTFDLREVYYYTTQAIGEDVEPEMPEQIEGENALIAENVAIDHTWYNPNWSNEGTFEATYADGKLTCVLPAACNDTWQAQLHVNYGVTLVDGANYKLSAVFKSAQEIQGVTFKMSNTCSKTFNLKAGKEWRVILDGAYEAAMNNMFVMDFGRTPAENTIEIYDLKLVGEVVTAVENVATATSTKLMRDGQLIIIRNGVEYNALGQQIR